MFLFEMEEAAIRAARLANLVERTLHRLGDSAQKIWTYDEVESYLQLGAREMVAAVKVVWDAVYAENLPAGFHCTADWEEELVTFRYGIASYTYPQEGDYINEEELDWELDDLFQANHTCPSEVELLAGIGASTEMRGIVEMPKNLIDIERATWDSRGIDATAPRRLRDSDAQYQETAGEVIAYSWREEGPQTLRKIRVPAEMADTYTVQGSWGIVRDVTDIYAPTVEGTWGTPRRVPYFFPLGDTEGWGIPRRFYRDGKNVRVEHFRQMRINEHDSELPARYFIYLLHYCQWMCLKRNGPGQDYKLAQLYKTLWDRGIARIDSRGRRQDAERVSRMGGSGASESQGRPPRPKLPYQYGSTVRR